MRQPLSARALRQLAAIYDYIALDSVDAAERVVDRLLHAVELLQQNPHMGRESELRRRRELVVDNHVLIYSVQREGVFVHSILHGARRS